MLRLTLGFGSGSMTQKSNNTLLTGGQDAKVSGFSGSFSLDVGAAPVDNLIIHARLSDMVIVEPNLTVGGMDLGTARNTSLAVLLFGPALTYYFMPINIYLTGAIGVSNVQLDDSTDSSGSSHASKAGLGLNIDAGKEWWVSNNWGLGAALRFWYTHTTDQVSDVKLTYDFLGFAVLFSATYQ
jgi:hypothetical protein